VLFLERLDLVADTYLEHHQIYVLCKLLLSLAEQVTFWRFDALAAVGFLCANYRLFLWP